MNILLIEEKKDVLDDVARFIRLSGHHITFSRSASEALKIYFPGRFDLVVADFEVALLTGLNPLADVLRVDPALKLIILTPYAPKASANPFFSGTVGFIEKPFGPSELEEMVEKVMSQNPKAFISTPVRKSALRLNA